MSDDLPSKDDFSDWYNELLFQAEIMDVRYPAKGVYVWFPFGQSLRNQVFDHLKELHDETGHDEAGFPVLIPEGILAKEAEHIEGFEDEVFWVTHGGRKELDEKLALRPTSETPMYTMFDLWIRSHDDLPLKIYQVANIWRSETEHTRPLIRLREITSFKEAHTAHESYEKADDQVRTALSIYDDFYEHLSIPYVITKRPEWDKFPGAEYTVAVDTLMPDGKALQIGTAHNLGQNFSETFDVEFETRDGSQEYVYQTSYGISERSIAAVMSVHGDDTGLVLPSEIAPTQVTVIPILFGDDDENQEIMERCREVEGELEDAGYRVEVDDSDDNPGAKYYDLELHGTPLRVEIGPRDLESESAVLCNREGDKSDADFDEIVDRVEEELESFDDELKEEAQSGFDDHVKDVDSVEEAADVVGDGFAKMGWCGVEECGKEMEDEVGGDMMGTPYSPDLEPLVDAEGRECGCGCGREAETVVLFAKTY
ncbi:MAG: proline--tRNA ligase [Halobacteria archaeon]